MRFKIILGLAVLMLFVIFVLQNAEIATIKFLMRQFEASLSLVLLATFLLGVVVGTLLAIPLMSRKDSKSSNI